MFSELWMNEDSVLVVVWKQSPTFNIESSWKPTNTWLFCYCICFLSIKTQETHWPPLHLFVQMPNLSWGSYHHPARSYFRSLDLLQQPMGSFLDFVIPGGALGNTAAAFMAREMGLPLRRLLCGVTLWGVKVGAGWSREFSWIRGVSTSTNVKL